MKKYLLALGNIGRHSDVRLTLDPIGSAFAENGGHALHLRNVQLGNQRVSFGLLVRQELCMHSVVAVAPTHVDGNCRNSITMIDLGCGTRNPKVAIAWEGTRPASESPEVRRTVVIFMSLEVGGRRAIGLRIIRNA